MNTIDPRLSQTGSLLGLKPSQSYFVNNSTTMKSLSNFTKKKMAELQEP